MSEPQVVYEVGAASRQGSARRQLLTRAALDDSRATEKVLMRLVAYGAGLREKLEAETLDDAALLAVKMQLRDLRKCVEALGVGVP